MFLHASIHSPSLLQPLPETESLALNLIAFEPRKTQLGSSFFLSHRPDNAIEGRLDLGIGCDVAAGNIGVDQD